MNNEKSEWMFRKLEENIRANRSILNGMIDIHFVACSVEEQTAEFLFTAEDWERNVYGGLHGGMIATVLDSCMGITAGVFSEKPASTVSMNVQYLQPGAGTTFRVLVSLRHRGRRIIHMAAELRDAEGGSCAQAEAVFTVRESMNMADRLAGAASVAETENRMADGAQRENALTRGEEQQPQPGRPELGRTEPDFLEPDRLEAQLRFLMEADREKEIVRRNYLASGNRRETDAEHAWHLALMVMLLKEYANAKIDPYRTMCMCLTHDLVEVYAGDTYAYETDERTRDSQAERERAAADRLFAMLPPDQGTWLRGLWEEFEAWDTPEAKFAKTLDHFQPLFLNSRSGGKSWIEHGVKASQILKRNERTAEGSEILWARQLAELEDNIARGIVPDDRKPV